MKFGLIAAALMGMAVAATPDCELVPKEFKRDKKSGVRVQKIKYEADQKYAIKVWSDYFTLKDNVAGACDDYKTGDETQGQGSDLINFEFVKDDCTTALGTEEQKTFEKEAFDSAGVTFKEQDFDKTEVKSMKMKRVKIPTNDVEGFDKGVCVTGSITGEANSAVSYKINMKQRSEEDTKYFRQMQDLTRGDQFKLPESSTGFKCGMKGYKNLVQEMIDLAIIAIPMMKEVAVAILPEDLGLAIDHLYLGLTGAGLWIGYVVAAAYYMATDQGYGVEFCEAFGILYIVVDTFHVLVDWDGEEKDAMDGTEKPGKPGPKKP